MKDLLKTILTTVIAILIAVPFLIVTTVMAVNTYNYVFDKTNIEVVMNNEVIYKGPSYKVMLGNDRLVIYKNWLLSKVDKVYYSKDLEVKSIEE